MCLLVHKISKNHWPEVLNEDTVVWLDRALDYTQNYAG